MNNRRQLKRMMWMETKTAKYVNGCSGKVCHPSRRIALSIKRAMLNDLTKEIDESSSYDQWEELTIKRDRMEKTLTAYKCTCCGRFHLGNDRLES